MWKRATWHECADELEQISEAFRNAYWGRRHGSSWPRHPEDERMMAETSKDGVQLLRALAVAVRAEQDFALVPNAVAVCVGALKERDAEPHDVIQAKQNHGYEGLLRSVGYVPLGLRQALNKIVHADPRRADYYVGAWNPVHELLLFGTDRGHAWFAAISIPELAKAIRTLPDAAMV